MSTYIDTSVMMSLQLRDSAYATAHGIMQASRDVIWTQWQKIEFGNAMRARVWRKDITIADVQKAETSIYVSLRAGNLVYYPLPACALWQEAEALSLAHTTNLGVRTLDLLHVAAARVLNATHFYTFDTRQHALARAAGLKIN